MTGSVEYSSPEDAFGAAVRRARESRSWSQETLATRLADAGIHVGSQSGIARIEKGQRPTRLNEVIAIAQFLDINLHRIYASRGTGGPTLEDYRKVSTEDLLSGKRSLEDHLNRASEELAVAMVEMRQQRAALEEATERLQQAEHLHKHFHRQLFDIREELQSRGVEMKDHGAEMRERFSIPQKTPRTRFGRKQRDGE